MRNVLKEGFSVLLSGLREMAFATVMVLPDAVGCWRSFIYSCLMNHLV